MLSCCDLVSPRRPYSLQGCVNELLAESTRPFLAHISSLSTLSPHTQYNINAMEEYVYVCAPSALYRRDIVTTVIFTVSRRWFLHSILALPILSPPLPSHYVSVLASSLLACVPAYQSVCLRMCACIYVRVCLLSYQVGSMLQPE